ncbi:MAG: thrombospondin type 3 repeat-containing protein [Archangium sp.]|nr:thrombospondin type 3 repeat-containing protein [Archangium sp.]
MKRTSLLLFLVAVPAWATDTYPAVIQNKYSLAELPPELCALCHTNGITGAGTVNTPFGRAVRMRGLVANDTATLNAALDALATESVDSDGDGVTDVAELMAGTSPNVASMGTGGGAGGGGGSTTVIPPPRFGCGAAVIPELVFLAALFPLLRRRRARQP